MNRCQHESRIDDYLFNRLSEAETRKFEEHYFNCPVCFKILQEKSEMAAVIRAEGDRIFKDLNRAPEKTSRVQRLFGQLSIRQWATAAVSAAVILFVAVGVLPHLKKEAPRFYLDDDMVRGRSITLISDAIPAQLGWIAIGGDIDYKVSIYNSHLLWETTTRDNFIPLPDEVKAQMKPGVKYYYQVKAFSPEGTLVAQSSKVQLPPITD